MVEDEPYELGYRHGKTGYQKRLRLAGNTDYELGYEEGTADRVRFDHVRPVDDEYYIVNDPPEGFEWAGYKNVPQPGDYYLSKNGNGILAEKVRGNNQKRHILKRK